MKKVFSLLIAFTLTVSLCACNNGEDVPSTDTTQPPQQTTQSTQENSESYADAVDFTIELENGAVMKGELYPNLAPKTVENFIKLCKKDFYDGLIFHRVIKNFMIQGGGYDAELNPKDAEAIVGEFSQNGFENNLKHTKGVLSMARTTDPNSAASQFFIVQKDSPHLDGAYAAFGRITEGLQFIDEIATAKTETEEKYGMQNVPTEPIVIKTITID